MCRDECKVSSPEIFPTFTITVQIVLYQLDPLNSILVLRTGLFHGVIQNEIKEQPTLKYKEHKELSLGAAVLTEV